MPWFCKPLLVSAVVILGLAIGGCSEKKVSQCNRMIEVANQVVEVVDRVTQVSNPQDAEALTKIADTSDRAVEQMQAVTLTDQQLQTYRNRFVTMYADIGKAARSMAMAIDQQDAASFQQGYRDLQRATSQESALVTAVNGYCGSS